MFNIQYVLELKNNNLKLNQKRSPELVLSTEMDSFNCPFWYYVNALACDDFRANSLITAQLLSVWSWA